MTFPLPFETERLTIRPIDPVGDLDALLEVYGDPEVMRFIPGGAQDVDAVRATLATQAELAPWAVVERASGAVIGDVGFGIFAQTDDVEIGWTLARGFWGRGYATEAARACLAAARLLEVSRVIAVVDRENAASLRVAERLGMTRTDEEATVAGRPHTIFAQHFLLR